MMNEIINRLSADQLAAMIDHTFLKAYGTAGDIEQLCSEAIEYQFSTVMVHPSEIDTCKQLLSGSSIRIGTVIGFPLGQNSTESKVFETRDAVDRGAVDIDMVINNRALQKGQFNTVIQEIESVVLVCKEHQAICKVILETCYLTDEEKEKVCRIAVDAGADYVKTSTGFGTGGATIEDIKLMRRVVGEQVGIKASGGIRDLTTALAMIKAGASRLGTSGSVSIVEAYRKLKTEIS
ncbi:MAG: deoxyribose-phosphate aldolase [Bacteroidales bacterium]|nr:deoxyribose-phosphate aldolase [Bacteroidales bacterium]